MKTADYYDTAADYTGVVREIANEINGLTLDGFRRWYYSSCEDFYYRRAVQLASPDRAARIGRRKDGKFLPLFEGEKSVRADRLIQRLVSRLYVLRRLRMVRNTFTLFFENETAVLARRHERHLDRALDKKLYLAQRLAELSQELHPFVRMLCDARAGNTWLSKLSFEFDPRPLANEPRTTSQNLARALHFRVLLADYEGYKTPAVADKLSLRQVALLHIYEGQGLDSAEAVKAAAKAGYSSRTSGQKLMKYYNALAHHTTNRIRLEGKALSDMIKDIARVVALLNGTAREQAESELKTLQARK